MSLPSSSLSVPGLSNDQLNYGGGGPAAAITLGSGTVFGLHKLEGLDKPNVRQANSTRPRFRGSYIGLNQLDVRQITATFDAGPITATGWGSYTNLAGALKSLRSVTSTEGTTEYPLWLQLPNFPLVCTMARVVKKSIPWDLPADLGSLVQNAAIQWEATDPYFYAAPTLTQTVSLPSPSGGFSFNFPFNLSFGGTSTPNTAQCFNTGDVPCWPLLTVTGPCTNPQITCTNSFGVSSLTCDTALNNGDTLVIDCDAQTVTYYPVGQTAGASRINTLQTASTFFSLSPFTYSAQAGLNLVTFNSGDTSAVAGTLTIAYTSTYDALT